MPITRSRRGTYSQSSYIILLIIESLYYTVDPTLLLHFVNKVADFAVFPSLALVKASWTHLCDFTVRLSRYWSLFYLLVFIFNFITIQN